MPAADMTTATATASPAVRKSGSAPEKKYKCQFCNRAFSRSEHRSRHERSREFTPIPPGRLRCGERDDTLLLRTHVARQRAAGKVCPQ